MKVTIFFLGTEFGLDSIDNIAPVHCQFYFSINLEIENLLTLIAFIARIHI
jgi:hypothetical protein